MRSSVLAAILAAMCVVGFVNESKAQATGPVKIWEFDGTCFSTIIGEWSVTVCDGDLTRNGPVVVFQAKNDKSTLGIVSKYIRGPAGKGRSAQFVSAYVYDGIEYIPPHYHLFLAVTVFGAGRDQDYRGNLSVVMAMAELIRFMK